MIKCPDCNKAFATPSACGAHRAGAHGYRAKGNQPKIKEGPIVAPLLPTPPLSYKCNVCGKSFFDPRQLGGHVNAHKKKKTTTTKKKKAPAVKELTFSGDKDDVRFAMQSLAAVHLRRIPKEARVAICLPGDRPEHELKLLSNPGFAHIHMVELNGPRAKLAASKGFDVKNVNLVDYATELASSGTKLTMLDFDICGTVTYSDGSALLDIVRNGRITDVFCIRITSCRRSPAKSGRYDVEAFGKDLELSLVPTDRKIVSRTYETYVGKERIPMMVAQWVIQKVKESAK